MTGFRLREAPSGKDITGDNGDTLIYNAATRLWEPGAAGGGGAFTNSAYETINNLAAPIDLALYNAPPAFAEVVVSGFLLISWVNNEAESVEASGTVTFEISTDSGVTFTGIGDPVGYTMQNPSTASVQQSWVNIPFVTRTLGPATGNVILRATVADQTTGASLAGGEFVATGVFTT